ncbi:MAG TPA: hypothetical protein PLJ62_12640 [Thermoflexales bacterium]|nr:hypothetical protein [Thermoflexales bacterium]HQW33982.1 hypothetical protein [Thermoflexales bacterium]HQZ23208.1 hypothetical protein [Thermoflexales bacterium]HRA01043.1 hypothetical protein [Thermoflexales bacterium]
MQVIAIDLSSKAQTRQFLELPFWIYRDIPQWVPPLEMDAKRHLNTRANPFFQHSTAQFLLAVRDGVPVGRLAVLNNRNYNAFNHEKTAHWFLYECEDDPQTSRALFDAGFDWARAQGLDKVHGPKGFTALDGLGLLVKGFEHRPAFGIPYNPSYYPAQVEAAGFVADGDIVSGYLPGAAQFPQRLFDLAEKIQQRPGGLRIQRFTSRAQLRAFVPKLRAMYNGALSGTQGNVPLTDDEASAMANQMLFFADPKLIKIITKNDEPVGFMFAYPDIGAAVQRQKGRVWPFGWMDMLMEFRRSKWVNVNGAGILEQHRGMGGTALLFTEMAKSVQEGGFEHCDIVQIGVENDRMQRELRDLGIEFYKTHRMYMKLVAGG